MDGTEAKATRCGTCSRCGARFVAGRRGPLRSWCRACAPTRSPSDNAHRFVQPTCDACGMNVGRGKSGWRLRKCSACRKKSTVVRWRRRALTHHVARCKRKGLPCVGTLTRLWIHERDEYRCMLCGRMTDSTDKRRCPVVAHIVPVNNPLNTKHGHTPNTQDQRLATADETTQADGIASPLHPLVL